MRCWQCWRSHHVFLWFLFYFRGFFVFSIPQKLQANKMENYRKGKNIEEPLDRSKIPIPNLPPNFLWMHVRGGSKIRNLLSHALAEYTEARAVVWTGFGPSVGKAVTCSEIMKREAGNTLHQITRICYRSVEEFWDPVSSDLEQIVVRRKLPMIHILLSVDALDVKELGYQAPGVCLTYKSGSESKKPQKTKQKNKFSDSGS